MGYFSFSLTKQKGNDNSAKNFESSKNSTLVFKFGFPLRKSQDLNLKSSESPSKQPILSIDRIVADNLTPPPTPSDSPQASKETSIDCSASTPNIFYKGRISPTPPQSPTSNSPGSGPSQRRSSFGSVSLFRTPRQRKLQEIQDGKLPAILCDSELRRNSKSSGDSDSIPTEICDPSSSTTYSPRNRQTRSSK